MAGGLFLEGELKFYSLPPHSEWLWILPIIQSSEYHNAFP